MDKCRLVVIHWSILLLQFWNYYSVHCASVYSNIETSGMTSIGSATVSSATGAITVTKSFPSSPSSLSSSTPIESLCSHQIERYMKSEGKESSLIFELQPNSMTYETCKRTLTAPESHGFFIRLIRPNQKKLQNQSGSGLKKNHRGMSQKLTNSTYSCPLRIYSTNDLLTPWRIDPCQIELNNDVDEPVRLIQGRMKIAWEHGGNSPSSRLMITVLGKGAPCLQMNKHPCLRFGFEILFCISKDLVCDGVRHCPKGNEYDSDEDHEMCSKKTTAAASAAAAIQTTMKIDSKSSAEGNASGSDGINPGNYGGQKSNSHGIEYHGNFTRTGTLASDLSKYGPWGYLMLGMLLCGGALLICGLWECCCRQNKSGETTISASTLPGSNTTVEPSSPETTQDISPPNYDEIDPPPAYSSLFPNKNHLIGSSSQTTSRPPANQFERPTNNINNSSNNLDSLRNSSN